MKDLDVPAHLLGGVSFSLYSKDEIRKLSVKEVNNPVALDAFLHPTYGGLYDPHLGATENDEVCDTCGLTHIYCPGHMGHINLPAPVYNPVLFGTMIKLLKASCFNCQELLASGSQLYTFQAKMEALDHGLVALVDELEDCLRQALSQPGSKEANEEQAIEDVQDLLQGALEAREHSDNVHGTNIKNVVELRQQLCKEFLSNDFWTSKCPHCSLPARPIRTENSAKVFFIKGVSKGALNKYYMQKMKEVELAQRKKKKRILDGEEEEEAEDVQMDETEDKSPEQLKEELSKLEGQHYLTPSEIKLHLRLVWDKSTAILSKVFKSIAMQQDHMAHPTDVFFFEVLPVPPARFRPRASLGDMQFDNPQTANYTEVLKDCGALREAFTLLKNSVNPGKDITQDTEEDSEAKNKLEIRNSERVNYAWIRLQVHVNRLIDMDLDKISSLKQPGIKQIIEKKEGLFRMNMMGKRVNFACRSVISPDPYINTNEIGIPMVFARKLTFPQPVTPWNFQELKQAVLNGPDTYPGATMVELEDGQKIFLRSSDPTQREAQAKQLLATTEGRFGSKKVHRHLKNGDILLLNRQPTLHRPSIQAHKARVLGDEKTLRLHYANCKAYNADFDGDEMNAHFPQDEISRAEAYTIACTDFQYLVPKDGTPLAGLIQDHMVSGVRLTLRGQFFNRSDYQQLVFRSLTDKGGRIKQLPPALIKPQRLWSGKQVLSTLLINLIPEGKSPLNLIGKAKVAPKNWNMQKPRKWRAGGTPLTDLSMSESEVVIRQGELLVGVLDKGHYGNTPYGLVHCCYELYGGQVAGQVLTCLARLFTCFLQIQGFTLGVQDILCLPEADAERHKLIKESKKCGPVAASRAFNVDDPTDTDTLLLKYEDGQYSNEGELKDLDLAMKGQTDDFSNRIAKAIIPDGLIKHFPHNNLQLMVQSGAKGSSVNCMQISCLLGQIELEGRRPPLMLTGKPLPSFPAYDFSPRSGGFITGRFLTGIRPQEYFFHCMAGREGLVDTAVKTSRSGYLQRCIIKHLEGIIVHYDHTVRDADGSILQFNYGEDGLDIPKTQFLKKDQIPFLISNQDKLISSAEEADLRKVWENEKAKSLWKKMKRWKKKHAADPVRYTPFLDFCDKNWADVSAEYSREEMSLGRSLASKRICDMWADLNPEQKAKHMKDAAPCPDPVLTQINVSRHLGVVSEPFESMVDSYISSNPDKLVKHDESDVQVGEISADRLRTLLYMRNQTAQVQPGEAVGLLAAQSIGEPSTQMTLNTFHFAGRGEMNVTLGIPRLREILMVASAAIKTPNMDVPILNTPAAKKKAKTLKKKFTKVLLSQVLEDVSITETMRLKKDKGSGRTRLYTLRFSFLPHDMYKDEFNLTPNKILRFIESKFFLQLQSAMQRKYEEISNSSLLNTAKVTERVSKKKDVSAAQQKEEEEDGLSDTEAQDDDATAVKRRERQTQNRDYQGEEEEKEEAGLDEEDEEQDEDAVSMDLGEENSAEQDEDRETLNDTRIERTPKAKSRRKSTASMDRTRVNHVLSTINFCTSYKYDADEELWCEITFSTHIDKPKLDMTSLLDELARKAIVFRTPGVSRGFLTEGRMEGEPDRLKIEGVNLQEMHKYDDCLDLNKLYTNDIHAVSRVYGIEAASRAIIKEVRDVFAAYGITVDYHHLSLVADYMTFEGRYKAFNRTGIESNPSPLQKMSFETTMNFLKSATISGAHDDLRSPSSRLIVGRTVMGGTGCFDLIQPQI